jgi:uncharacterized phiE125 gp8 family phage protein
VKVVVVTPATAPPVSISEARTQCALLDDTSHDPLLGRLIAAATASVEIDAGTRLMEQTLRLDFDGFPMFAMDLGLYPVSAVTEVAYDDENEAAQTLTASTDYWADTAGMYPRLVPNTTWPATQALKPGTVRVTVTAGYSAASEVPEDIRHAILLRVGDLFVNREEVITGLSVAPTTNTVRNLMANHRRVVLG